MDTVQELFELLRETKAPVRIRRPAPSILYDGNYQICLLLIAIKTFTETDKGHRVLAPWLTLAQFVAARPRLLPRLHTWLKESQRKHLELGAWQELPRGYLTDTLQSQVRDFLSARQIISQVGDYVHRGIQWSKAESIISEVERFELFTHERATLLELSQHKVTKVMFGAGVD